MPADRGWNEQITLNVALWPGEELEPGLAETNRFGLVVAVENTQAAHIRIRLASLPEMLDRAGGLTAAENHRRGSNNALKVARHTSRPTAQNVAITWALDIENERRGNGSIAASLDAAAC